MKPTSVALPRGAAPSALALRAALGGCATIRAARGGPGRPARSVGELEPQGLRVQRGRSTTWCSSRWPPPTQKSCRRWCAPASSNFFGNFADAWSAVNNLLQGKVQDAAEDLMRVGTNTIFGLFGVFDVASEMNIEHHNEDFGQTLGRWGVGAGRLPRAAAARPVDACATPLALPLDRTASPALLDQRRRDAGRHHHAAARQHARDLLGASRVHRRDLRSTSTPSLRDAYLQRRRSLIFDGDAPEMPISKAPPGRRGAAATAGRAGASAARRRRHRPPRRGNDTGRRGLTVHRGRDGALTSARARGVDARAERAGIAAVTCKGKE